METVLKTFYKTKDGKYFVVKKDAEDHEKQMSLRKTLSRYLVAQSVLPWDNTLVLLPNVYKWYKAENEEEYQTLLGILKELKGRTFFNFCKKEEHTFPLFFGVSDKGNMMVFKEDVEYKMKETMERYQTLMEKLS